MDYRIFPGDTVSVDFHGSQFTLCARAQLLQIPQATGDSWVVRDLKTNAIHYVSEGCTITRLAP